MGFLRSVISNLFSREKYGTKCITLRGEKVKSKAEKMIADYFYRSNIGYEYEKVAKTHAWLFGKKISRPDFYLPDYNVYIEYWGMIDVDKKRKRSEYLRNMKWKMSQYHKNKIKFISIYPNNLGNINWIFKKKFKEVMGQDLP